MKFDPRPYQIDADEALHADLQTYPTGNPLVVVPTGGGKAYLIAKGMQRIVRDNPNARIMNATHVSELVVQNFWECRDMWPEVDAGIYSAGANRRQTHQQIIFAGVQSVYDKAHQFKGMTHLFIDEAHLISGKDGSMYVKLINGLISMNPNLRIVGFTATPYRLDTGGMIGGDDSMFHRIAYDVRLADLVKDGYLSPLRSKNPETTYNLTGVRSNGGDWNQKQLAAAINQEKLNVSAVMEFIAAGQDRLGWLPFCVNVAHAEAVANLMCKEGYNVEVVHGNLEMGTRKRIIERFKQQGYRGLASVGVLTTGFNAPHVDLVGLMRSTQSTGLYVQMLGRGTRLSPATGKVDCLVMDYGENIKRFGPVDMLPSMPPPKVPGMGEAPVKECPECAEAVHISIMTCPGCGYEFPPPEKEAITEAETEAVMSTGFTAEREYPRAVREARFYIHQTTDERPDSLRAEYVVNRNGQDHVVKQWVAFEGSPGARHMAQQYWIDAGGALPSPSTAAEAHQRISAGEISAPASITMQRNGNYWSVVGHSFTKAGRVDLSEGELIERGYTGKQMLEKLGRKSGQHMKIAEKNGIVPIGKDQSGSIYFDRERIDIIVAKAEENAK